MATTSFWKIFFGVLAAVAVAGSCVVGACVVLIGSAALTATQGKKITDEYRSSVAVRMTEADTSGGYITLYGSIRNDGKRAIRYWKVRVRLLDAQGNLLTSEYANSNDVLGPGESARFHVMARNNGEIRSSDPAVEDLTLD